MSSLHTIVCGPFPLFFQIFISFATLKDAEAVLGTHGMLIDDHFVADDAGHGSGRPQRPIARLEQHVLRTVLGRREVECLMVTMLFARKVDEALCETKQLFVLSRFTEMAVTSLKES